MLSLAAPQRCVAAALHVARFGRMGYVADLRCEGLRCTLHVAVPLRCSQKLLFDIWHREPIPPVTVTVALSGLAETACDADSASSFLPQGMPRFMPPLEVWPPPPLPEDSKDDATKSAKQMRELSAQEGFVDIAEADEKHDVLLDELAAQELKHAARKTAKTLVASTRAGRL